MDEEWIKLKTPENGYTYRKVIMQKRKYLGMRGTIFQIIFKPNLVKKGFYNDDS
jgi:hypothetical protein